MRSRVVHRYLGLGLGLGLTLMLCACGDGPASPGPAETRPAPAMSEPAPAPTTPKETKASPEVIARRARAMAHRYVILDGHVDLPYRLEASKDEQGRITEDISEATAEGDFDLPRAKAGGLDAPFMSIYIPAKYEKDGGAMQLADRMIDMVEGFAQKWPAQFALARSPTEVRANFEAGKISLPMGMENGAPIEGKLENLRHFHERGIRYITLTHSKNNHISDSSFDDTREHQGLSAFGKQVVTEMNRLGIMIDVSHISDDAFWQVMEISKVPVIASHSSCRHFTPGWARNMGDDMIKALAENGGVIQINFGSSFISEKVRAAREEQRTQIETLLAKENLEPGTPEAKRRAETFRNEHPAPFATLEQVADHIDHVVALVGVDHVGFGSDFDGVGDSLPTGIKSVADYPNLLGVLIARGYSDADIQKICSGNVLRVWQAVEDHAKKVSQATD